MLRALRIAQPHLGHFFSLPSIVIPQSGDRQVLSSAIIFPLCALIDADRQGLPEPPSKVTHRAMASGMFRLVGAALSLATASGALSALPHFSRPATAAMPPTPRALQIAGADDPLCRAMPAAPRRPVTFARRGNHFAILARHPGRAPELMGTLNGRFSPAGELWCSLWEINNLDHVILDIFVTAGIRDASYVQFRGPSVSPAPAGGLRAGRVETRELAGSVSGLTRRLSLYQPRVPARRLVVLFDVDSTNTGLFRRVDALIARGAIEPTLLIGIAMAADPDPVRANDLRLDEMHAGREADRYRAFERFVFADVLPGIRREFPGLADPARIAFIGESASAAWVIDHAAAHGRDAGAWGAFALPNGTIVSLPGRASGAIFMGGGTFDPDYLANGLRVCAAILRGGGNCRFATVHSGHGQGAWDELIAAMLVDWSGGHRRGYTRR
jgi:hypothetical protein